ncbi:MAG: DUF3352 domain-containing protein [Anaerolineales bacterium]|nr:DUF3352 domain-containing protein [Anaerolineales bacterium]
MNSKKWIVAGAAVLVVGCLCLCCGGSVIVIADPFQIHLLDLIFGRADPLVQSVPDTVPVIASIDLKSLASADTLDVINAFAGASGGEETEDMQDYRKEKIDPWMEENLGVNIEEDILPWLGQFVDLAVFSVNPPQPQQTLPLVERMVLLAEIRDREKADSFIGKLIDSTARKLGIDWAEDSYGGVTVHRGLLQGYGQSMMYLARSGNILLWTTDELSLRKVIDTQSGSETPISKAEWYRKTIAQLPGEKAVTFLASGNAFQDLSGMANSTVGGVNAGAFSMLNYQNAVQGVGFSLTAVPQGLRMYTVANYDTDRLTTDQQAALFSAGALNDTERLPDATLAFLCGQNLGLSWKNAKDLLLAELPGGDFDETMQSLEKQIGFNPDEDLFPYLTGDWSIALLPNAEQGSADPEGADLGYVVSVDTSDEDDLRRTVGKFNDALEHERGVTVEPRSIAGIDAYRLISGPDHETLAVYGVGKDHLTIASSDYIFMDVNNGGSSITSAAVYEEAWSGIPTGFAPVLYFDLRGIMDYVTDRELTDQFKGILDPVLTVVFGTKNAGQGTIVNVVQVNIEK